MSISLFKKEFEMVFKVIFLFNYFENLMKFWKFEYLFWSLRVSCVFIALVQYITTCIVRSLRLVSLVITTSSLRIMFESRWFPSSVVIFRGNTREIHVVCFVVSWNWDGSWVKSQFIRLIYLVAWFSLGVLPSFGYSKTKCLR